MGNDSWRYAVVGGDRCPWHRIHVAILVNPIHSTMHRPSYSLGDMRRGNEHREKSS